MDTQPVEKQAVEVQNRDVFTCPGPVVLPVFGCPGVFEVRVSDSFYRCFIGNRTLMPRCECSDHVYRKFGTNVPCKHIEAALDFVKRGQQAAADEAAHWFFSLPEEDRKDLFR